MKFNDGAEVYAADGRKLGELGQVVLDPHTSEVITIVVQKGYFFTGDKTIPAEDIQQALAERVTLYASAKIESYPDFVQTDFIPFVGEGNGDVEASSSAAWYPPFWNQGA
jgi:uncharacterized protein YrrD